MAVVEAPVQEGLEIAPFAREIIDIRPHVSRETFRRLLAVERDSIHLWLITYAALYLPPEEFRRDAPDLIKAISEGGSSEDLDQPVYNLALRAGRRMGLEEARAYVKVVELLDPYADEPFELTPKLLARAEEVYAETVERGHLRA